MILWRHRDIIDHHLRLTYLSARLTHWGLDEMAAVAQTTILNAFSWMKMIEFPFESLWNLFLRVHLTISQQWFKCKHIIWLRYIETRNPLNIEIWQISYVHIFVLILKSTNPSKSMPRGRFVKCRYDSSTNMGDMHKWGFRGCDAMLIDSAYCEIYMYLAWIDYYIYYKVCYEITYPFPNLRVDKFHPPLYWVCDYLSMLRLKLILVGKRGHRNKISYPFEIHRILKSRKYLCPLCPA